MFAINKEFDHLFVWDFLECDQFYVKKIGSEAGKKYPVLEFYINTVKKKKELYLGR
jgi:hypothetical protein